MTECERIIKSGLVEASFIKKETRCEYEVSEKMKKVWCIELDLIQRFDAICKGTIFGTG